MDSGAPDPCTSPVISDIPTVHVQDLSTIQYSTESSVSIDFITLLSNTLIANEITPHLPITSLLSLSATCHTARYILSDHATKVRYLDLSPIRRLCIDTSGPLDPGGTSWRAERMDESLTEDDFYGGPIRATFMTLQRRQWLPAISTLILDGLTVTADVVREIVAEDRFNVRILSIRDCKQLNYRKLCQLLKYAVRPTRPVGTPKLRGLYLFGPNEPSPVKEEPPVGRRRSPTRYPDSRPSETVTAVATHLGHEWEMRTKATLVAELHELDDDKWYHSAGKIITRPIFSEWAETLQACEGIIHFDAVLCRGPRHNLPAPGADTSTWLGPAIATIALGPQGCQKCGTCPEGAGVFGQSLSHELPLLAPPPLLSSSIRAAQMPSSAAVVRYRVPKLIARCKECLKNRWCERCHKWWCESCYDPGSWTYLQGREMVDNVLNGSADGESPGSEDIKVHMGICVDSCLVDDWIVDDGNGDGGEVFDRRLRRSPEP
jgi:hypothetical protein